MKSCLPDIEDRSPPPPVVLGRQLEVCESDSNGTTDQEQQEEGEEEDAVEEVLFPAPHSLEHIVKLHRDGAEGDEASDEHLEGTTVVPIRVRDLPLDVLRPAGCIECRCPVFTKHTSNNRQGSSDLKIREHTTEENIL